MPVILNLDRQKTIIMEYKTQFSDFEENRQELVGKWVLWEQGQSYNKKLGMSLVKIAKVIKTGFRLWKNSEDLFSFEGNKKGLTSRMDMSLISRCTLLTDNEYLETKALWIENRKRNELVKEITELLSGLSLEKLDAIKAVIES